MKLTASVTRDDLVKVVSDLTPLRVKLGDKGRSALLERPRALELLPAQGVRIAGGGEVTWDVAGLPITVTVKSWQILLVPSVYVSDGVLAVALDPLLEQLDLATVPGFVDGKIASSVNDALAGSKRLRWAFGRTLAVRRTLPARVSPSGRFDLAPTEGEIEVTKDVIHFTVGFGTRVVRVAERRSA